jgi:hypothetical protein
MLVKAFVPAQLVTAVSNLLDSGLSAWREHVLIAYGRDE